MKRSVHLQGSLGEKFGGTHIVDCTHYSDAFKCIAVNRPGFKEHFINNPDIHYSVDIVGDIDRVSQEDWLLPLPKGDIVISAVPAGSKSGGAKILAAIAIAALFFIPGPAGFLTKVGADGAITGLTFAGSAAAALSINLALTGLAQVMAPDPATDEESPQSYLFSGSQQEAIRGAPVPLLYGELRVPGTLIGFNLLNQHFAFNNTFVDTNGNLILG